MSSRTTPERSAREGARGLEVYPLTYGRQTSYATTSMPSFRAQRAKGSSGVASVSASRRASARSTWAPEVPSSVQMARGNRALAATIWSIGTPNS